MAKKRAKKKRADVAEPAPVSAAPRASNPPDPSDEPIDRRDRIDRIDGTDGIDRSAPIEDIEAIEIDLDADDGDDDVFAKAQRRAPRIRVNERVEISGFFSVAGAESTREDLLVDASPQGVFVETAQLLDVGDPVVLHLPLAEGKRLRISGRVRWVTPFGGLRDARPGMGIELVSVAADTRIVLDELLQTMLKKRLARG